MGPGQPAGTQWGQASSSGPSKCQSSSGQALTPRSFWSPRWAGTGLCPQTEDGSVPAVLCTASSCFLYPPNMIQSACGSWRDWLVPASKRSSPARSLRATTGPAVPCCAAGGLTPAF